MKMQRRQGCGWSSRPSLTRKRKIRRACSARPTVIRPALPKSLPTRCRSSVRRSLCPPLEARTKYCYPTIRPMCTPNMHNRYSRTMCRDRFIIPNGTGAPAPIGTPAPRCYCCLLPTARRNGSTTSLPVSAECSMRFGAALNYCAHSGYRSAGSWMVRTSTWKPA